MENKIKRFLSLLLALVMVIGMMPMGRAHAAATAPVSGKKYVILNVRGNRFLTNTEQGNGLTLAGTIDDGANPTLWTITASGEGYTIQDPNGKYLTIADNDADLQVEAATVNIGLNGDTWTISQNNAYLNQHGGGNSNRAAGWQDGSAAGDDGSQWMLYEYVSLDLDKPHSLTVDGEVVATGSDAVAVVAVVGDKMTGTYIEDVTTNETLKDGKYVLLNTRASKYLQSTSAGGKLYMDTIALDFAEKWLITADGDGYTMQASNGQYLTISGSGNSSTSGLTDEKTIVSFTWKEGTWQVGCNGTYLNDFSNGKAGGYNVDGDGGSQWKLYKEVDAPAYTWTLGDQVTEPSQIEDGGYYIFENNSASGAGTNLLSGMWSDTNAGGSGSGYGLKLWWNKTHITEENIWKITGTAGNYNVQHLNGWNLFIASGKAVRTPDRSATVIGQDSSNHPGKWQISVGGIHLNRWGGATAQVAGWGGVDDGNSQWNIYEVIPTALKSTEITFTAKSVGNSIVTAGDVNYFCHVHNYTENVVTAPDCENAGEKIYVCDCGMIDRTEEIPVTNRVPVAEVLNGDVRVALSDCEYTFTKGEDGNFVVSATTADGTVVYLNHFSTTNNNVPNLTSPAGKIAVMEGTVENMFKLQAQITDGASGDPRTLHFHAEATDPYWNRCARDTSYKCQEYLYRQVRDDETSSTEIPGYVRVTCKATDLADGKYLIAAKNDAGNWYVLNPANSNNKLDHVAKVSSELHAAGHKAGEPVRENITHVSYDLVTRCAYCDKVMATETVYTQIVVKGLDVSLPSEIQLKYTVIIPDAVVEAGAYVVLTKVGGYGTVTTTFANEDLVKNEGVYEFGMGIASGEVTCPVTIEVFDAEGNALNLYNKTGELGTSVTKTVEDYVELVLKNEKNTDEKKALAKALLVYGGYAQTNFRIEAAAPKYDALGISTDVSAVTLENLASYTNSQTNKDMGVKATTISTFVDSYTAIRVYLAVAGELSEYTFTLTTPNGDVEITPVLDGERYYVDIPEIASGYIDHQYQITVTKGDQTNVITASVLGYVRSVLNNENNSEAKMNLAKALYLYNQAADAFFVQNNNANS